jgi:hypothetical protein
MENVFLLAFQNICCMHRTLYLASLITIFLLASCNPYKYVPEGQFMLKKVTLEKEGNVPKLDFNLYLHQTPNSRFLNFIGVNLLQPVRKRYHQMDQQNAQKYWRRTSYF